jgi:hypothetical protein
MTSREIESLVRKIVPTPLDLPAGAKGDFRVEQSTIKAGESITVVSMRTAILSGLPSFNFKSDMNIPVHTLKNKGGGIITSDTPQELVSQYMAFKNVHGHVLVGGLGIGMAPTMIANLPKVSKVTVIEIEKDVIDLVYLNLPRTKAPLHVMHGDVMKLLENDELTFDSAYMDIWSGTGEGTWVAQVVPIRRMMRRIHGLKHRDTSCWQEDEMRGQIFNMTSSLMYPSSNLRDSITKYMQAYKPAWVFWQGFQKAKPKDEAKFIRFYTDDVGSPKWEATFPWDEFKKVKK